MICVGFGPAALAVAVALHDKAIAAKVLFVEQQRSFAWHAGMLLPHARMQISFLKDLATLRDPRSRFTFLNYLRERGRLEAFTNLSTFLPLREEFNDYLTWAAGHFNDQVRYATCVTSISPRWNDSQIVSAWTVAAVDVDTSKSLFFSTKRVIIAQGGVPKVPKALVPLGDRVVHSSRYLSMVPRLAAFESKELRLAVVGGGQSAAEIFDDLTARFSEATIQLFFSDTALRPSDDSPL